MLFQIFALILLSSYTNGDCTGKNAAIVNGIEYRLFFERVTAHSAQKKCKQWGIEWKSTEIRADLIKEIGQDLQTCLKQMIESNVSGWDYNSKKDVGYFIGGSITSSEPNGWRWNKGGAIPLPEEDGFDKWAAGSDEPQHRPPLPKQEESINRRCMSALMMSLGNGTEVGDWVDQHCDNELYYICQRDVPKDFIWGYSDNKHAVPPHEWADLDETFECNGRQQSPVDIQTLSVNCGDDEAATVLRWENEPGQKIRWNIKNTGRMIRIDIQPKFALYTLFGFNQTHQRKQYVDYLQLKWGSNSSLGSEHTIGGLRHAGEMQIFHEPESNGKVHALAFMLQQRPFQENRRWSELLTAIIRAQEANTSTTISSPPDHILRLLNDSSNTRHFANPAFITGRGVRYEGSLTHPPCTENVIWTVYPRPVQLSFAQFTVLRKLRMEGKMGGQFRHITQTTREIQTQSNPQFCSVQGSS